MNDTRGLANAVEIENGVDPVASLSFLLRASKPPKIPAFAGEIHPVPLVASTCRHPLALARSNPDAAPPGDAAMAEME